MIVAETDIEEQTRYEWSINEAIKAAEASGIEVVRSACDRILLDLDTGAAMDHFRRTLPRLANVFDLKEVQRWKSNSGIGTHVVLSCAPLPFTSRIAIAACLGSDPIREGLAIAMSRDRIDEPSVLFKPAQVKSK